MNSVSKYILDKKFTHDPVRCGIGIDYGTILVAKVGIVKHGSANTSHRDLVWLGRPANVASKLADLGNKEVSTTRDVVREAHTIPYLPDWRWVQVETRDFLNNLDDLFYNQLLRHKNPLYKAFYVTSAIMSVRHKPILMTQSVWDGFRKANPNRDSVKNSYWVATNVKVPGYSDKVWGGDVHFTAFAN